MKRKSIFIALLCAGFVFTGCEDEKVVNPIQPAQTGDEVIFDAGVGTSGPKTRTIYGDKNLIDGRGTQAIHWQPEDKVQIYSPEALLKDAEYTVVNINQATASLQKTGELGIRWGEPDEHRFYAVYPSPANIEHGSVRDMSSFEQGVWKGHVPTNQPHTIKVNGTKYSAQPNMDYCSMTAVSTVSKSTGKVNLAFKPIITALDIVLEGREDMSPLELSSITIEATDGSEIAGDFSCDLTRWDGTNGYPACEYTPTNQTLNQVTIPLYYEDNSTLKPITVDGNTDKITITAFLLPHKAQTNLRVTVSAIGRAQSLSLTNIILNEHKKTVVNITLPDFDGAVKNNWVSRLNDNILFTQLSIPGSANAFSYRSDTHHKTQLSDVEQQWSAGIRCFELVSPEASGRSLGVSNLTCNRRPVGITFKTAIDQLMRNLDANPREFLMIIPSLDSNQSRRFAVPQYIAALNRYFDEFVATYGRDRIIEFNPNLTVKDVRGKVIFINRITSEEDASLNITTWPKYGMTIHQWGSLKDNWQRRGYTLANGTPVPNWATRATYESSMEYFMMNENTVETTTEAVPNTAKIFTGNLPQRVEANTDFAHEIKSSTPVSSQAYVQHWGRVAKASKNYRLNTRPKDGGFIHYYAYWQESWSEKQNDIWNTFTKAIEDNKNGNSPYIFINSLDGYFITDNLFNSYLPYVEGFSPSQRNHGPGGTEGDIQTYATEVNSWFYNNILMMGTQNITGPMGLIIMDYILGDAPGRYLPQIIIENNFKFPLLTGGNSGNVPE